MSESEFPDALEAVSKDGWRQYDAQTLCTAIHQRFLALGAAVANLEARVIELEACREALLRTSSIPLRMDETLYKPLGPGPLEPEKIGTTDAPGG